jgi:hypothetical protein
MTAAEIRRNAERWPLPPGRELTFGRGSRCDIRFAYDPVDDLVSRRAGTLIGRDDGVLIRNDSSTQDLLLQAIPGPQDQIAPGMTLGTTASRHARLVIPGRHHTRYELVIDARPLAGPGPARRPPVSGDGEAPTRAAAPVTARERRLLAALSEPVLLLAGPEAVPATYREVAARVGQTPASVRTCLDALRQRLSDRDGLPDLRDAHSGDYRRALARWAIQSGTVTTDDIAAL